MAEIIDTIQRNGETILVYDNGMQRDKTSGQMRRPPDRALITTTEKSNELQRTRQQKRQELARLAALEAVERDEFKRTYGDDAYFVEIINAAQQKATNIDDPKMIDAARFVLTMTGDIEKTEATGDTAGPLSVLAGLGAEMVKMLTAKAQEYNDA